MSLAVHIHQLRPVQLRRVQHHLERRGTVDGKVQVQNLRGVRVAYLSGDGHV